MAAAERVPYDEFSMFHENAEEFGIPYDGPPTVRRESVEVDAGRRLSALVWGDAEPELVLLHGGAQNAHTWDTVALALDRPLVAVDLPGHGHSDGARTGSYDPRSNAEDVATAIRALAPNARAVVGMSLGGMTALALTQVAPELVRSLVLVDITPGVDEHKAGAILAVRRRARELRQLRRAAGPHRRVQPHPVRVVAAARHPPQRRTARGRHLGVAPCPPPHGRRRARRAGPPSSATCGRRCPGMTVPVMLVRGMRAQSVVSDDDEAEVRRRRPDARVEHVAEAGHSVQGDTPVELAALIADFVDTTTGAPA